MANSAFNHEPSFTIPGSTTDNALIRWDGTSGGGQLNSGIIIDDSNVITGITSLTVDNLLDHFIGHQKQSGNCCCRRLLPPCSPLLM